MTKKSMNNSIKFKLLDNYQLYQLIQNDSIDKFTLIEVKTEFNSRNLTEYEKSRIKNKYDINFTKLESQIDKNNWNPLYTAFAINRHFRHLAFLKIQGRKKEAKKYMIELYFGLAIYFGLIVVLIFIMEAI